MKFISYPALGIIFMAVIGILINEFSTFSPILNYAFYALFLASSSDYWHNKCGVKRRKSKFVNRRER